MALNQYNRLSIDEREFLYKGLAEGKQQKDIAKELNRDPSTISREIRKDRAFDDLNHYLDVNFRLLKEDFTSELREGLHQYQHDQKRN